MKINEDNIFLWMLGILIPWIVGLDYYVIPFSSLQTDGWRRQQFETLSSKVKGFAFDKDISHLSRQVWT